jgi:putative oxidoreductase
MTDLKLSVDDRPARATRILSWLPRIAAALFFFSIGRAKFASTGEWVAIFDRIGIGQWFRYATGALQVAGAVLMLVPRIGWLGAALLACTMLGATIVQIGVFHSPVAIMPAMLCGLLVVIALSIRGQGTR